MRFSIQGEELTIVYVIFVVATCMLIILILLFVPTNARNSYKIVKLLKTFKIITVAPTHFGLHKPSSGSSQPVFRQSYNVDIGYIYRYLKLSILWLHAATVSITESSLMMVYVNRNMLEQLL